MGSTDPTDRRKRYAELRDDLREGIIEGVQAMLEDWSTGDLAVELFGIEGDSLDALYLMSFAEEAVRYSVSAAVRNAWHDGWTWTDIGAALGISRQAAAQRFEKFGYQRVHRGPLPESPR